MSFTEAMRRYFLSVAQQAGDKERVAKYALSRGEQVIARDDMYSLTDGLNTLFDRCNIRVQDGNETYVGGISLFHPEPHTRCRSCGSSDFKQNRCQWCRGIRETV